MRCGLSPKGLRIPSWNHRFLADGYFVTSIRLIGCRTPCRVCPTWARQETSRRDNRHDSSRLACLVITPHREFQRNCLRRYRGWRARRRLTPCDRFCGWLGRCVCMQEGGTCCWLSLAARYHRGWHTHHTPWAHWWTHNQVDWVILTCRQQRSPKTSRSYQAGHVSLWRDLSAVSSHRRSSKTCRTMSWGNPPWVESPYHHTLVLLSKEQGRTRAWQSMWAILPRKIAWRIDPGEHRVVQLCHAYRPSWLSALMFQDRCNCTLPFQALVPPMRSGGGWSSYPSALDCKGRGRLGSSWCWSAWDRGGRVRSCILRLLRDRPGIDHIGRRIGSWRGPREGRVEVREG